MPRGPKVPIAMSRDWLKAHEGGARIDELAKRSGRTERTIRDHIEAAREELEQQQVRAGLLRDAYQAHREDLFNVAQELCERAHRPNPRGLWFDAARRSTILRDALYNHIPKSELWTAAKAWEEQAKKREQTIDEIRALIAESVGKGITTRFPESLPSGFRESVCFIVERKAMEDNASSLDYSRGQPGEHLRIMWGGFALADNVPSEARWKEIGNAHMQLVEEVLNAQTGRIFTLRQSTRRLLEATDVIESEIDMLILRHILPGRCSLCPGGEGTRAKKRRSGERLYRT